MARTVRQWLCTSDFLEKYPQLARFIEGTAPQLWVPQRRSVALGAGIGAAVSVVPLPAQALIAALAAMRFKAHLPTAVVLTFLSNPLTTLPLLGVAWMIGAMCMGQPVAWPEGLSWTGLTDWHAWVKGAGQPLLVGIPILAAVLGVSCFALTHVGWRLAIVRKWRTRPASRRAVGS